MTTRPLNDFEVVPDLKTILISEPRDRGGHAVAAMVVICFACLAIWTLLILLAVWWFA